jgi:hypothetical protein
VNAVASETGGGLWAMAVVFGVAGCIDERAAEGVGKGVVGDGSRFERLLRRRRFLRCSIVVLSTMWSM